MQILVTIVGVALGAALWLWILRRYDKIEPEAVRHLVTVGFVGGLVSVSVAAFLNEAARSVLRIDAGLFGNAPAFGVWQLAAFCLAVAVSEELCKAVATVYTTRRFGDLDEPIDAMIYAMTVALGFAAFENVLYASQFGNDVLLARFLWPVPAHMAYAALWGYGLAQARFVYPARRQASVMAPSVALAVTFHAGINFLLFLQYTASAVAGLLALATLAVLAHYRLRRLVYESPFLVPGECPACRHVNPPDALVCEQCHELIGDTEMFVTCPNGCARVAAYREKCPVCGASLGASHGTPLLHASDATLEHGGSSRVADETHIE